MESRQLDQTSQTEYLPEAAAPQTSLLGQILDVAGTVATSHQSGQEERKPTVQRSWEEMISGWAKAQQQSGKSLDHLRYSLSDHLGQLDSIIESQVNAILHHPSFQSLESNWRGLHILCQRHADLRQEVEADESVGKAEIRFLSVRKKELQKDFDNAVEFDQSQVFKKIYEEEYGMSGGTPYGMVLANFEFTNHPNDVDLLTQLSGVGAAAFCPIITSATPSMLGVENFSKLEQPLDLDRILQQAKFKKWESMRKNPDTQFLGVTLPRILMRLPHEDDGSSRNGFRFQEDVSGPDRDKYLWGPASWGFACVILRAFLQCGWFADIRGMQRGVDGGGVVDEFPVHSFGTDTSQGAQKASVEVAISDRLEQDLSGSGFIPLTACQGSPFMAFYSNQSVHEPVKYTDEAATMNARVSSMLQYVLCCSRVAHFLRIEARNKIGSLQSAQAVEDYLLNWITDYVMPDEKAAPEMKAKFPLLKAEVQVDEVPGKPGSYKVVMHLLPHYQLDALTSTMTLTAREVSAPGQKT